MREGKRSCPGYACITLALGGFVLSAGPIAPAQSSITSLATGKAMYAPGDSVTFSATLSGPADTIVMRARHLDRVLTEVRLPLHGAVAFGWTWLPPAADFQGYLVEAELVQGTEIVGRDAIAIDVSSGWNRFPRYGFLADFGYLTAPQIESVVQKLNRNHINGLQFYDWEYKHHMPLKGTSQSPAPTWSDIAKRTVYFSTVQGYINAAHRYGMTAMAYNLLYGSWFDAFSDGVDTAGWSLYKDAAHTQRDYHPLPPSWASNIYVMDPTNALWKTYLFAKEKIAFQALAFDGWHVDQLGDRGTEYNYQGKQVPLQYMFSSFLSDAKSALNTRLVFNAVNQYGQSNLGNAPVDFLYTEVWSPNDSYGDIQNIINANGALSESRLNTVLAAYMDYDIADAPGAFNPPGVLLTDAVIFASGGAHLELGEHMLAKEYFPNQNLTTSPALDDAIIRYYDVLTAYENILRDSVTASSVGPATPGVIPLSASPRLGTVWAFVRETRNLQMIHLINLVGASSLQWRDGSGTQAGPVQLRNIPLSILAARTIDRVWCVSPDTAFGVPVGIAFRQDTGTASFAVPFLSNWTIVVIEYLENPLSVGSNGPAAPREFSLQQSYPNPSNGSAVIRYTIPVATHVTIDVFDPLGRAVCRLVNDRMESGLHEIRLSGTNLASGIYFYRMRAGTFTETRSLLLLK